MRWSAVVLGAVIALAVACAGHADKGYQATADTAPAPFPFEPRHIIVPAPETPPEPGTGAASGGCGLVVQPGDASLTLETAEGQRSFRVHLPPRHNPGRASPLVLNFHGYSRDAMEQETYSGLLPLADTEGFILVTPDGAGYPLQWNVVDVYGDSGVDDVAFTVQLVDHLAGTFCVDLQRVYATGISNGGEMAAQVGCLWPGVFAAVAPVAGVVYQGCQGRAMPVVSFHGTWDYNVPFETAPPAMAEWARHNSCAGDLEIARISESVTRESYSGCSGADVVLYVIDGGGHTWPDAEDESGGVGPTTHEINANRLIWEFFRSHPMPSPD